MDQSPNAVAVIGSDGFLGGHLVRALERARRTVASFTLDVPFDLGERLDPAVESARTIFWLASTINPQIATESPERVAADRAVFERLFEGLERASVSPTIVLLSSGGTVYDPKAEPPYREDSPLAPLSAYGQAKVAFEELMTQRAPGKSVAVRVANAYGPGQHPAAGQGVIAYWMAAALEGKPVTMMGEPTNARDYVFATDIAEALVAIDGCEPDILPSKVNVGSGQATSLQQLADTLAAVIAPRPLEVLHQPSRSFDVKRTWLSIDRAADVLGWKPRISLHEGLSQTWAALQR